MRNLTKTLAVVTLLAPASAQPLGIGDLKLHSALNQKLNAEIDLMLSTGENPAEIQVRMAAPEKFDEAGVPWNYFLSKIKFEKVVQRDGSLVVKLSSNEALQEPFLDFLLEVTWTNGNLYREFTVLVDPPVAYEQPVVPLIEKAAQPVQKTEPAVAVTEPVKEVPRTPTDEAVRTDQYGPTTRGDTLWTVAEKVVPSSDISTEQMIMALYRANPHAFYRDNVNALMAGHVLNVPDQETVLKLSKSQAAKLFRKQVKAWRTPVEEAVLEKPAVSEQAAESSQLELVAPVESEVAEQALVSPEQEQASEGQRPSKEKIAPEPLTSENEAADQATDQAMQQRVRELEDQLAKMQRLLTLKDEQLAALQNKQLTEQKPQAESAKTVPAEVKQPIKGEKQILVKPKPKPKAQRASAPEPEGGFFGDTYYLLVGGLSLAILGGLGWLWWRKRSVEEQSYDESMFASSSEIRMPDTDSAQATAAVSVDDASTYDVGTVGESSFLSEFTPSDFDAFDSDLNEVDPISEADVYLAYGRYQQAEELMRQAIKDEPERNDCKLKLLEIFYAHENKEAFEEYARELVEAGMQNDPTFWSKVVEMGNEIIPNSEVLNPAASEKADTDKAEVRDEADFTLPEGQETIDLTAEETLAEKAEGPEQEVEIETNRIDFDLSSLEEEEPVQQNSEEQPVATMEDAQESIEFDLSSFSEGEGEEKPRESIDEDEIESFDFDFTTDAEPEKKNDTESDLSLDLGVESEGTENRFDFSDIAESSEAEAKKEDQNEEFDFNFDFEETDLSGGQVSDLTDMDEFETKIDLAKAYIDMGDEDAAKSIAEEVLEKGSDQQKKTAQTILDQL